MVLYIQQRKGRARSDSQGRGDRNNKSKAPPALIRPDDFPARQQMRLWPVPLGPLQRHPGPGPRALEPLRSLCGVAEGAPVNNNDDNNNG